MTEASRLDRRLGFGDAVVVGLGSMIGAGVFSAFAPAAAVAGGGLLIGLVLAASVAFANATSSAQLAARYPMSGGTYVYGRERLGHLWGFLAGWAFVAGKTASCAAMALTFASYASPENVRLAAAAAVGAIVVVNLAGVQRTVQLTRCVVALVLASLAAIVASGLSGGTAELTRIGPVVEGGPLGVLRSGGLLFFAFAGYARLSTMGEEVKDPRRIIPRAIPLALGLALAVYGVVAVTALVVIGPEALADSSSPLAEVAAVGGLRWASPVARAGAAVASGGVLLSLLVGVSRTVFAMSSSGDLPRVLAAVHPRSKVPHRAEVAIGVVVVVAVVAVGDLSAVIGFSSFAVLGYYAIANAASWTLPADERHWPRWLSGAGFAGCVLLAASLSRSSLLGGLALFGSGLSVWGTRRFLARRG